MSMDASRESRIDNINFNLYHVLVQIHEGVAQVVTHLCVCAFIYVCVYACMCTTVRSRRSLSLCPFSPMTHTSVILALGARTRGRGRERERGEIFEADRCGRKRHKRCPLCSRRGF